MLKLMKYEFRKMRTVLLIVLLALVGLELGFVVGHLLEKTVVVGTCVTLLTFLGFAAYAYILIAGVVTYARDLTERQGYLVFMAPVQHIEIVFSKLLATLLAAIAATAVFAVAAYFDYVILFEKLGLTPEMINQANMMLRTFFREANLSVGQLVMTAAYFALIALINIATLVSTAYLAVTLSATLLQNRKGFLRGLLSIALFVAISVGASWIEGKLPLVASYPYDSFAQMTKSLGVSLVYNLALCAAFSVISAVLLDRKVSL